MQSVHSVVGIHSKKTWYVSIEALVIVLFVGLLSDANCAVAIADDQPFTLSNTDLDWEVDSLRRVRVFFPDETDTTADDMDEIAVAVKGLQNVETFAAAHVVLSHMLGCTKNCGTPAENGYDIIFYGLHVSIRYERRDGIDHKRITFPNTELQQRQLQSLWEMNVESLKFSRKPIEEWRISGQTTRVGFGNRSRSLASVKNQSVIWETYGFGSIRPLVLHAYARDMKVSNELTISILKQSLKDREKFIAAHLMLSHIYGYDTYVIQRSYTESNTQQAVINGLTLRIFREDGRWSATCPDPERRQAWVLYYWQTLKKI